MAYIEILRRNSEAAVKWDFRQPKICLFWYTLGSGECRLNINGESVNSWITPDRPLSMFPAESDIRGEFFFDSVCEYTIIFIDPTIAAQRLGVSIDKPLVGFSNQELIRSLVDLRSQASSPDALFHLYAEGWVYQTLVHLARAAGVNRSKGVGRPSKGGLTARTLHRVEDYILTNLAAPITLVDLADVAGLSVRHFLRAFGESKGASPHRYILDMRLREARQMLTSTQESITNIALACGFSQSQHFSTIFKKMQGVTPSNFRHHQLSIQSRPDMSESSSYL
ncbi:helix-turn-helix domain-containing protein [Cupriavidus numazuensis]|nr:AraC family transcriptional regulator [Cupriavidus numazuensis]